tara:strand:- start:1931 stop:3376 length:1446 start_codon:yes stop_codon:yes gene_type:complete
MALNVPGYSLTPSSTKSATATNYITDFDFLNQYLPDTYEKEFERYGNRTIASFLRMVGAEMPTNSDLIKWAEQGRLHTKFEGCTTTNGAGAIGTNAVPWLTAGVTPCNFRVGQTLLISDETAGSTNVNKAVVTAVGADTVAGTVDSFEVGYYEAAQTMGAATACTVFVYGSEFQKGTNGMVGSLESEDEFFDNKPIIIKDKYTVSGSDMAQIGWVEVTTENGASGYLWYLKSEHETRLRYDDYLEMSMIEGVPAAAASGALAYLSPAGSAAPGSAAASTAAGTQGLFDAIDSRGNVWSGAGPTTLADWDTIVDRLDKQGSIQENVVFVNRNFGFDIDGMLAAQNSYGVGGTSYGLFDNDQEMALNLGFTGFRRGYDFYKTDWKYLNDITLRGGIIGGSVNGCLVPAGSTTVYDQIMGRNAKRPFLHVRYRASETEDRRYKTWMTGSAGGASTSSLDAMEVNFLSERALCTLGANNFVIFKD